MSFVAVSVDDLIVRDNIGDDVIPLEEILKQRDRVAVALGSVHRGDDGVAGEDGGPGAGEHGVPSEARRGVEIGRSDQGLDSVVEVEPLADEGGGRVREARRVGVAFRRGIALESVERRLDPALASLFATRRVCFLG